MNFAARTRARILPDLFNHVVKFEFVAPPCRQDPFPADGPENLSRDARRRVGVTGYVRREQHPVLEVARDEGAINGDREGFFGHPAVAEALDGISTWFASGVRELYGAFDRVPDLASLGVGIEGEQVRRPQRGAESTPVMSDAIRWARYPPAR